jgi:hypothetical protein
MLPRRQCGSNALDLYFGDAQLKISAMTPVIPTEALHAFVQSLQANARMKLYEHETICSTTIN